MSDFFTRVSQMSQPRLALLVAELHEQLEAERRARSEPIAIIGAACRFPGGIDTLDAYWEVLDEGKCVVSSAPSARRPSGGEDLPALRYGGFLEHVDRFDAEFFGITADEARAMDPQHRLLLELAWEAVESAGVSASKLVGSQTGVFVGMTTHDYASLLSRRIDHAGVDVYLMATGTVANMAAGRISYLLGARGPCIAVDAACASSLVAVHLACRSLRSGESSMALAGAVSLQLNPDVSVGLARAGILSPDGRCRTFDASADGYVRSEGAGVVVLKRLSDALAHGDNILAVIRGSAVNQDGPRARLTTPAGPAQETLLRAALSDAGATPQEVGYVEVHGLGTRFGDAIEARALGLVYGASRDANRPLLLGSSKTNLGYLEAASGMASLLKTVLALQHEAIPKHLHLERPSPHIQWDSWPLRVPVEQVEWKRSSTPRLAGVSAFGFNGTDVHLVLEEAPRREAVAAPTRAFHLLCLSAKTEASLIELLARYTAHLDEHPEQPLADLCFTANDGRAGHAVCAALVVSSLDEAREGLNALSRGRLPHLAARATVRGDSRGVGLLFSDDRATAAPLGASHESVPAFRAAWVRCLDAARRSGLGESSVVRHFARQYAEAKTWLEWGVGYRVVAGAGWAAAVAACVAGACELDDALRLAAVMALPEADGAALARCLRDVAFTDPSIEVYSAQGAPVSASELKQLAYWTSALSVERCAAESFPQRITAFAIGAAASDPSDAWRSVFEGLARLFVAGITIDWTRVESGFRPRRVPLPTYPFRRQSYWFNEATPNELAAETTQSSASHAPPAVAESPRSNAPPARRISQFPQSMPRPMTLRRSAHFFADVVHDSHSPDAGPGLQCANFAELVAIVREHGTEESFARFLAGLPAEVREAVLAPPPRDEWLPLAFLGELLRCAQAEVFAGDRAALGALGRGIGKRRYVGPGGSRARLVAPDMLLGFALTSWPEWYRNNGRVWVARRDSRALAVAFKDVTAGSPEFWCVQKGWLSMLLELCEVGRCSVDLIEGDALSECELHCIWER